MQEFPLDILTVSFHSEKLLELNAKWVSELNPNRPVHWIVVANDGSDHKELVKSVKQLPNTELTLVKGPPGFKTQFDEGSYHHACGLNLGLQYLKNRYLLVLDPDFFIVRDQWISQVLQHMAGQQLAFFGAPWDPGAFQKYRNFPCVHCFFIDLEQAPAVTLDFSPDLHLSAQNRSVIAQLEKLPRPTKLAKQLWRWAKTAWMFEASRDTGSRIYQTYEGSSLRSEVFQFIHAKEKTKRKVATLAAFPYRFRNHLEQYRKLRKYYRSTILEDKGTRPALLAGKADVYQHSDRLVWKDLPFAFHLRRVSLINRSLETYDISDQNTSIEIARMLFRTQRKAIENTELLRKKKQDDTPQAFARILKNSKVSIPAKRSRNQGPKVLFATSMGGYHHGAVLDALIAMGLVLRGARSDFLLCDGFLPSCQLSKLSNTPIEVIEKNQPLPRCSQCFSSGNEIFETIGLPTLRFSDWLSHSQEEQIQALCTRTPLENIPTFQYKQIPVGEHALAGALRYFATGELSAQRSADRVLRRYFESALRTASIMERILKERQYDVVVAHHGIYVPQGMIVEACKQQGTRVVTWNPAYKKHCFIYSHHESYHHTMVSEPCSEWESFELTPSRENQLQQYLKSRWYGTNDWIWFHEEPQHDFEAIVKETGLDKNKPIVTLLSNVVWDAQLHYPSNAFPGMLDWVMETIRYFIGRPDLQLAIRIHPAEVTGFVPSRQPLKKEIEKNFSSLPENIFIIAPESQVSTYALSENSNAVLIYNTKTGMEVTAQGIPTIVAGEAWVRDKGFTHDARSAEEYFKILESLPFQGKMSAEQTQRARKYAYHIFFRRMIELPFLEPLGKAKLQIQLEQIEQMRPGNYPGLDAICRGILDERSFIQPAPRTGRQSSKPSMVASPAPQEYPAAPPVA